MFGVDYPQFESIFERTIGEVANLVTTPGVTDADTRSNPVFERFTDFARQS
jgi:hypothetical protein